VAVGALVVDLRAPAVEARRADRLDRVVELSGPVDLVSIVVPRHLEERISKRRRIFHGARELDRELEDDDRFGVGRQIRVESGVRRKDALGGEVLRPEVLEVAELNAVRVTVGVDSVKALRERRLASERRLRLIEERGI